jgi:hypothetical protein
MPNQKTGSSPLTVVPIERPKPGTWYYGMRCACTRLLALCEDLFSGNGADDLFQSPGTLAVRCECGRVSPVRRLQKFQQP